MPAVQAREESQAVLRASDLGLFDRGRWVWRHFGLELSAGERVVLKGPSGSGKTALLRVLSGLLNCEEGQILLDGKALGDWSMPGYRSRVAYLAQRPVLSDAKEVEALIRLPFSYHIHASRQFPEAQLASWLEKLGRKPDLLQRQVSSLSGGEQQLVALLRMLALDPQCLLLDEPTAALDAPTARQVEQLLADWLAGDDTRCWLWVSHDEPQMQRVSDRVVEL